MLSYSLRSEIGTREEQQDYAICFNENNLFVAVVCDGMGGLEGGYAAGKCAAETFMDIIKKRDKTESMPSLLLRSVDILDEKVSNLNGVSAEKLNSGTTIVAVIIKNGMLYWLSVGDSRLYLMRQKELVRATRDHNYSLILNSMPQGYIPTEEEIQKKEALVSYIGIGGIEIMDISRNPVSLLENDKILLTTDGLFKSLTDEQIKLILSNDLDAENVADNLLEAATKSAPNSRDNSTFIFINYKGE